MKGGDRRVGRKRPERTRQRRWEEETDAGDGGGWGRKQRRKVELRGEGGGGRNKEQEGKGGDDGRKKERRWQEVPVSCSTLTGGFMAAFRDSISAWVIHTLLVDCRRQTAHMLRG